MATLLNFPEHAKYSDNTRNHFCCCAEAKSALPSKTPECKDYGKWDEARHPMTIARMYELERYDRAIVRADFYLTSSRYKGQRTRDNSWIRFDHYLHPCASATTESCTE